MDYIGKVTRLRGSVSCLSGILAGAGVAWASFSFDKGLTGKVILENLNLAHYVALCLGGVISGGIGGGIASIFGAAFCRVVSSDSIKGVCYDSGNIETMGNRHGSLEVVASSIGGAISGSIGGAITGAVVYGVVGGFVGGITGAVAGAGFGQGGTDDVFREVDSFRKSDIRSSDRAIFIDSGNVRSFFLSGALSAGLVFAGMSNYDLKTEEKSKVKDIDNKNTILYQEERHRNGLEISVRDINGSGRDISLEEYFKGRRFGVEFGK